MITVALLSFAAYATPPAAGFGSTPDDADTSGMFSPDLPVLHGVTGGRDVEDDLTWPDVAAIYVRYSASYTDVSCTGVLIAPDVVLTAGHCIDGIVAVKLGVNNYNHDGEYIDAADIIEYPDSQGRGYDIAVILLEEESEFEPRVIGTDCIREEIVDGAPVTIVGYGATNASGTQYTPRLQEGFSEIVDADCSETGWGCSSSLQPSGELGGGGDGVDACYGDSGGPLYLESDRGTYVVGIVSRAWYGEPCGGGYCECGEGGIWVRPDKDDLFEWIEEVTDRTLPRPQCSEPPDPEADPIYTAKNVIGDTTIDPRDPEDGDVDYEITAEPGNGIAVVTPDGLVRFTPEEDFIGSDAVVVRVTDDAGLSEELEIAIKVMSKKEYRALTGEGGGCGCAAPVAPSGLGLAALAGVVGLITRRRR